MASFPSVRMCWCLSQPAMACAFSGVPLGCQQCAAADVRTLCACVRACVRACGCASSQALLRSECHLGFNLREDCISVRRMSGRECRAIPLLGAAGAGCVWARRGTGRGGRGARHHLHQLAAHVSGRCHWPRVLHAGNQGVAAGAHASAVHRCVSFFMPSGFPLVG